MNLAAIKMGVGFFQKMVPVIEAIAKEVGPLFETEVADGKAVWAAVTKSWNDFKAAVGAAKAAAGA